MQRARAVTFIGARYFEFVQDTLDVLNHIKEFETSSR